MTRIVYMYGKRIMRSVKRPERGGRYGGRWTIKSYVRTTKGTREVISDLKLISNPPLLTEGVESLCCEEAFRPCPTPPPSVGSPASQPPPTSASSVSPPLLSLYLPLFLLSLRSFFVCLPQQRNINSVRLRVPSLISFYFCL